MEALVYTLLRSVKLKIDPLQINWNKETDITVLYGPDFSDCRSSFDTEPSYQQQLRCPILFQHLGSNSSNSSSLMFLLLLLMEDLR